MFSDSFPIVISPIWYSKNKNLLQTVSIFPALHWNSKQFCRREYQLQADVKVDKMHCAFDLRTTELWTNIHTESTID